MKYRCFGKSIDWRFAAERYPEWEAFFDSQIEADSKEEAEDKIPLKFGHIILSVTTDKLE